jgi:hypothetical protein
MLGGIWLVPLVGVFRKRMLTNRVYENGVGDAEIKVVCVWPRT